MRVLALSLVMVSAVSAGAQSLGDVARREAERRKAVKAPGKTYTNDQLKSDGRDVPSSPVPPAATTAPAGTGGTSAAGGGSAKGPGDATASNNPAATKDLPKDEAGWKARLQAERDALSRSQMFADALQSRINGLSADYVARDDPAQRSTLATDRQKALAELDRVRKDIEQHTKGVAEIQEDARRAGVPAGWVR